VLHARHRPALDERSPARRSELAIGAALAVDRDAGQVAELRIVDAVGTPTPPVRPTDAPAHTAVGKRVRGLATGEDHRLIVCDLPAAAYPPNG
jgi:hypothetical protein